MKINLRLGYVQNVHARYQIRAKLFECFSACIQRYRIRVGPLRCSLHIDVGNQNHSFTNHSPVGEGKTKGVPRGGQKTQIALNEVCRRGGGLNEG